MALDLMLGNEGVNNVAALSFNTPRDTVMTTWSAQYELPSPQIILTPSGPSQLIDFTSLLNKVFSFTGSSSSGLGYFF